MARQSTVKHIRKAGAFTSGELAAGEIGVDVTNETLSFSIDGAAGIKVIDPDASGSGTVDTANSPNANEFARFTDANTIEGRTAGEVRADLDLEPGTDFYSISAADALLADKAPLASPAFTGNPTAPTPSGGDNDTSIATTAFVHTALAAAALGLTKRQTVRAATTGNVTIATALNNGDSIDGVTLADGDLVLVKSQTAPEENGVYEVGASPARFSEFDTYNEHAGAQISVQEGSVNADTIWLCTANQGGTLNTTAINFTKLVIAGELLAANNLSDLNNAATARSNLGANDAANLTTGDLATARMQTNVVAAINAGGGTINGNTVIIDCGTL